ncbi:MAG TPA: hypothetical protein DCQ06_00435 [Myxococcales bacterium]|nr:hypothetical protein [Myxococcales bacterium]
MLLILITGCVVDPLPTPGDKNTGSGQFGSQESDQADALAPSTDAGSVADDVALAGDATVTDGGTANKDANEVEQ